MSGFFEREGEEATGEEGFPPGTGLQGREESTRDFLRRERLAREAEAGGALEVPEEVRREAIEADFRPSARAVGKKGLEMAGGESPVVLQVSRRLTAAEWRPIFLRILRATGNWAAALQAAQIGRATVKEHLAASRVFQAQYEEALADAVDGLELEAWRRARNGSDFLIWRLLQAHRPELYGDKKTIEHKFSQSERREAYAMAKREGLSDEEAREAVAAAEAMLRQSRGRGS